MIMLKYENLSCGNTFEYSLFSRFDEETERMMKKAKRRTELSRMLVNIMQDKKEIPMGVFDCAMSWLDHSNKTPSEIISIIFENNA